MILSSINPKGFTDRLLDHQVCIGIAAGFGFVDQNQLVTLVVVDQAGGRIDGERSAPYDQNICISNI